MGEFRMPALGADMTEGTLVEWLVHPGDAVIKGQPIAVIDTAKSAIEVECFEDGVIERLLVELDSTVPVGTPLAVIGAREPAAAVAAGTGGAAAKRGRGAARRPAKKATRTRAKGPVRAEPMPAVDGPDAAEPMPRSAETARAGSGLPAAEPLLKAAEPAPPATAPAAQPRSAVTPLTRRLAREHGVDLAQLVGTGLGGRITRADIEAASDAARRIRATPYARRVAAELGIDLATLAGSGERGAIRVRDVRAAQAVAAPQGRLPEPHTGPEPRPTPDPKDRALAMRRAIAVLMSRSKREIPHYYLSTTIDMAAALAWMREHNHHVPISERLVPAALLLKAAAVAAREVPEMNGFWTEDRHVSSPSVHLGVAVALRGGGLVAPALHDADRLPLPGLMAGLRDLVSRARAGRLRGTETADPTITVTSLGDQGVEAVFGVIYPPQVALVGFGKVAERPWAVDGLLGVRPCVTATLSADHRASDGAVGARYLSTVDRLLQKPEDL